MTTAESRTGPAAAPPSTGGPPTWIYGLFPFIGVILLVIATVVQFATDGSDGWRQALVVNSVTYLIGAQAIGAGIGHMFFGPPIAASIGWRPSPFQWEVGGANLGLGIAGVWASSFDPDYWLAVIIVATGFLWVAAVGHVREIIREKNLSVSNAGPILFTDVLIPAFCLVIWLMWATP